MTHLSNVNKSKNSRQTDKHHDAHTTEDKHERAHRRTSTHAQMHTQTHTTVRGSGSQLWEIRCNFRPHNPGVSPTARRRAAAGAARGLSGVHLGVLKGDGGVRTHAFCGLRTTSRGTCWGVRRWGDGRERVMGKGVECAVGNGIGLKPGGGRAMGMGMAREGPGEG